MRVVSFLGDSLEAIRSFPDDARREAGFQIDRVQRGFEPDHWKPMSSIGPGVREIRIAERAGAFRVIYVAAFAEAVHVLHAFQKKSRTTAKRDLDLAAMRFRELLQRTPR
jgi:phage-related protein